METSKRWKYSISKERFTVEGTTIAALLSAGRTPEQAGTETAFMHGCNDPEHLAKGAVPRVPEHMQNLEMAV